MRYSLVSAALIASVSGHGLVTSIKGANGVVMPGLSVADGTPRDCSSNGCGSQADTSIIDDNDIASGQSSALGVTQGNGNVEAAAMISNFMAASGKAPKNNGAAAAVGAEDDLSGLDKAAAERRAERKRQIGNLFGGLFGGGGDDAAAADGGGAAGGAGGFLGGLTGGGGGTKAEFAAESSVADSAGAGATEGLPTCSDTGEVSMVFRQINQDGAGPMTADIDGTSGGTDAAAFQSAAVTQDVPGLGFGGLSLATSTEFPMTVQMPAGMTCDASVGGADNVCVVRVRNSAAAGPFGGSAAFTQSKAARKRAVAYRLKKRMEINRMA